MSLVPWGLTSCPSQKRPCFLSESRADANAVLGRSVCSDVSLCLLVGLLSKAWVSSSVAPCLCSMMPIRAHQWLFQFDCGMRWGVERGFWAHPSESRRLVRRCRRMAPSVLRLSLSSVWAISILMVDLMSLMEGRSAPYSESGRKRRCEEQDDAIRILVFSMRAIRVSMSSSSVSSRGTTDR